MLHGINLAMNKINASYHGKCLNDFYSLATMHQKTHSFAAFTCLVFFNALQLVNKNRSCALSLDKYLCIATCTNLNWVTWKVRIGERKKLITLCRVFLTYPTSDRISPYNINTITGRQIMRI